MSGPGAGDGSGAAYLVLAGGVSYFLMVFGVGFVLGVGRTLWLAPRLGERSAELVEAPFMLATIWLAARWACRRFALGARELRVQAGVGVLGLLLLVATELFVVLRLRGLTLARYLEERDPVSGTVYLLSLLLFAAMPVLVSREKASR